MGIDPVYGSSAFGIVVTQRMIQYIHNLIAKNLVRMFTRKYLVCLCLTGTYIGYDANGYFSYKRSNE